MKHFRYYLNNINYVKRHGSGLMKYVYTCEAKHALNLTTRELNLMQAQLSYIKEKEAEIVFFSFFFSH